MTEKMLNNWRTTLAGLALILIAALATYKDPKFITTPEFAGLIAGATGLFAAADSKPKK